MKPAVDIVELRGDHHPDLVTAAWRLRAATGLYPPPQDCGDTLVEIERWWTSREDQAGWVALRKGQAVGHVAVSRPGAYLDRFCTGAAFLEISGLFLDPDFAGGGAGSALLQVARGYCVSAGALPMLAVVSTWRPAVRLYLGSGMLLAGGFRGRHGANLVFRD